MQWLNAVLSRIRLENLENAGRNTGQSVLSVVGESGSTTSPTSGKLEQGQQQKHGESSSDKESLDWIAGRLKLGAPVNRGQAAKYLGRSVRHLQRLEGTGRLVRCPGLGTVVMYAARDVLRLASA